MAPFQSVPDVWHQVPVVFEPSGTTVPLTPFNFLNLRAPKARIALCPVGIPGSHHIQGYVLILSEKYALIHWCLFFSHFSRCWVHQATFYLLLVTVWKLSSKTCRSGPVRSTCCGLKLMHHAMHLQFEEHKVPEVVSMHPKQLAL